MTKINRAEFFKKKATATTTTGKSGKSGISGKSGAPAPLPVLKVRKQKAQAIKNVADVLQQLGFHQLAQRVGQIYHEAASQRFAVTVVGEFNKGKSTFINQLIGRQLLPVGDLPTTAMLTRVCYGPKESLTLYDKKGQKMSESAISDDAWQHLTADNFGGNDPEGFVVVRTPNEWLGRLSIEIIDTPGANDLEQKRARQIGDALLRSDAVLITVSATAALSMSEELFIRQRILTHPNPFMALVVTKLDTIPESERAQVMKYVSGKLKNIWKIDIPVYVAGNVDIPGSTDNRVGTQCLKELISQWAIHPKRVLLTEQWMTARTLAVVDMARKAIAQKTELLNTDDRQRATLLAQKRAELSQRRTDWEQLALELQKRSNACYEQFVAREDEYSQALVERLQYECSHASSPQRWWKEDFPYRMKVELASMAVGLENLASQIIAADARWLNDQLERQFQTHIDIAPQTIVDKATFTPAGKGRNIDLEDLSKKRNLARVGTAALSIAGVIAFAGAGFMPLIATMGVGTGSSIMAENFFKGKIEEQQRNLKAFLMRSIPDIVQQAAAESESRLKYVYEELTLNAKKNFTLWYDTQAKAIAGSVKPADNAARRQIEQVKEALEKATKNLNNN